MRAGSVALVSMMLGLWMLGSCATPGAKVPSSAAQSAPADGQETSATSGKDEAPRQRPPSATGSGQPVEPRPEGEQALPGGSRRLTRALPSDPNFLRAPLPPPVPDRYASWREIERIDVGQSHLMEVDRLPSGRLLALSQVEGKVRLYERGSRRLVARHDVGGFDDFEPSALLAWPTAPDRYVLGTPQGLGVFEAASGALLADVDKGASWRLRWSADGRILMALGPAFGGQGSALRFFARGEGSELERLGELQFEERVDAWDLSRDARLLALVHYPSGDLRVLDLHLAGEQEIYRGPAPRYAGDVAFSPDGRFLAVAGDGLLALDLVNPQRVAFYSYVKNNMGHVRFSPSGDAVAASSYDGKLRIFALSLAEGGALTLDLMKELSHAGQANVYAFVFSADGGELTSASGDRTLRSFAGRRASTAAGASGAAQRTFHDLDAWKKLDPAAAQPLPAPSAPTQDGMFVLGSEVGPPRPTRIRTGRYACKITLIYKLRPCWVTKDAEGRTRLEFAADNLLHLGGVLWDDGSAVRFEGRLLTPSTVIDCAGCDRQPLHAVFRGQGGNYTGLLTFRTYHDPHRPPPLPPLDVRFEEANDRYPLVLKYEGPLDEAPGTEQPR